MTQHPIQVHVTVTGPHNMAIRTYVRDDKGWGCRTEIVDNDSGKVIDAREFDIDSTGEAIFDALRSMVDGFAMLMQPGEPLPELVAVAREQAARRVQSN